MCSQRETDVSFRFHSGCRPTGAVLSMGDLVVIKSGSGDFGITFEVDLSGHPVEIHGLAHQLIRSMLARGFDEYRVPARGDGLAAVISAIPFERVLSRGACSAGDRMREAVRVLRRT